MSPSEWSEWYEQMVVREADAWAEFQAEQARLRAEEARRQAEASALLEQLDALEGSS